MRASTVLQATWQRIRRPRTWGAALLFGVAWNGTRGLMGLPWQGLGDMLIPSVWVMLFLVLAPLPWQWTGNDAPMAATPRGAIQALPWMAILTLGLLLFLGATGGGPIRGRGPTPPPGMGMAGRGGPHHGPGHREGPGWLAIHTRLWRTWVAPLPSVSRVCWRLSAFTDCEPREGPPAGGGGLVRGGRGPGGGSVRGRARNCGLRPQRPARSRRAGAPEVHGVTRPRLHVVTCAPAFVRGGP